MLKIGKSFAQRRRKTSFTEMLPDTYSLGFHQRLECGMPIRIVVIFVLLLAPVFGPAAEIGADESKAAVLMNIARFVEWPPEVFASTTSPIVIGVLGDRSFGEILNQTLAGETVDGRPLAVKRFANMSDLGPCQLLYISTSEKTRLPEILDRLRGAKVLTVSEMDGFMKPGGIIRLNIKKGQVRFDINKASAEREGLKISSQLLNLAKPGRTDQP